MTTMTKATRAAMLALSLATTAVGAFAFTAASPALAQSAGGQGGGGGGGGAGGAGGQAGSGEGGDDHAIYRRIMAQDRLTHVNSSNCTPGANCNGRVPPRRPPQIQPVNVDESCGMPLRVVYDRNGHALWYACQPLPRR
ncbi:hypothetical protein [Chelatococcus composti]|jgi:hypothetical protein|uniref:Uncharacterized protein n=1 Tax=Chelatococcus composti TaxID=1743235 RepID=A0A841K862_9HYPH|nr:hypothetical protein [Chelatococcus composti]MBB6168495.1 hypothetical protein [Chelatococcus composti]MBS7736426.1 hypothetical protein [Chelatococcus composti]GGG40505.1 hypothetical protein GCM10008026_21810 [Chelatococcus composti]